MRPGLYIRAGDFQGPFQVFRPVNRQPFNAFPVGHDRASRSLPEFFQKPPVATHKEGDSPMGQVSVPAIYIREGDDLFCDACVMSPITRFIYTASP